MLVKLPFNNESIVSFWNDVFSRYEGVLYQAYSSFDCFLPEPASPNQIDLIDFTTAPWNHIMVYFPMLGGNVIIETINLNQKVCNGATFRQCVTGWALFQGLGLANLAPKYQVSSNSHKRAMTWEANSNKLGQVSDWNWPTHAQIAGFMKRTASKIALTSR